MNIYERLSNIQIELKAPKNQRNNFGKYNYRSAEDILEAVKPLCKVYGVTLTLSDKMLSIGNSVYVEATATLYDFEGNQIVVTASAREADTQAGMAPAQITGSSSSYARKYAMNGLFNIDDTKDDDFTNTHGKSVPKDTPYESKENLKGAKMTLTQKDKIIKAVSSGVLDLPKLLSYYKVKSVDELNFPQANEIIMKKLGK